MKQQDTEETRDRLAAVEQLAAMSLPIGSVEEMKRQSVPPPVKSALRDASSPRSSKGSTERRQ